MRLELLYTQNLLNLNETIAKDIFDQTYPWQVLPKISKFIISLGKTLPSDRFYLLDENIWVAKSAEIAKTASLTGPLIIDEDAQIRHCAFIRGNAIVGKNTVVGNSTELKNVILFNNVQVPHYNYVGDSILGFKAHLGAGCITSNVKSDKSVITISLGSEKIETGLKKFGAIISDFVEVGCNCVLNPGTVIGRNSNVYPLSCVRGFIPENNIYKNQNEIVEKF